MVKPIDDDRIYLVFNRELYHIPNMEVFNNLFIANAKINELPAIAFELLPKAGILYNARIIKGEGSSAIFLQHYDFKQHIANPETFDALQFDWNKVVTVSNEELIQLLTKKPINICLR